MWNFSGKRASRSLSGDKRENVYIVPHITTTTTITAPVNKTKQNKSNDRTCLNMAASKIKLQQTLQCKNRETPGTNLRSISLRYNYNVFGLFYNTVRLLQRQAKHCATSRRVAGSIPDGIIGIFY
jgi:hypothetical protein